MENNLRILHTGVHFHAFIIIQTYYKGIAIRQVDNEQIKLLTCISRYVYTYIVI